MKHIAFDKPQVLSIEELKSLARTQELGYVEMVLCSPDVYDRFEEVERTSSKILRISGQPIEIFGFKVIRVNCMSVFDLIVICKLGMLYLNNFALPSQILL